MKYPQLPIFAFLTAFLVLIPIPWHWRARNVATLSIVGWLFCVNFIYGVNSLIWAGNLNDSAPLWCDISSKIVVGASFALPLATICVCKHLEMVSSSRTVRFDVADKRRRMIFESVMCFGIPAIFMALHYIVQGHRYDIIEDFGCQATLYISIPAIFLMWFPPLLFSLITLVYAAIALHHFIRRRLVFSAHLQNSNSGLTTNRYLRLIAMALMEMVWGTVCTALNLWNNVYPGLRPWTNWDDVHSNFLRVDIFPAFTLPDEYRTMMFFFWSTMPASAFIFFVFFGFGEEAKKEYKKAWTLVKKNVLRRKEADGPGKGGKKLGDLLPTSARSAFDISLPLPIKSYTNDSESKSIVYSPTTPTSGSSYAPPPSYALMPPTPPLPDPTAVLVIEPTTPAASRDSFRFTYYTDSLHFPDELQRDLPEFYHSNGPLCAVEEEGGETRPSSRYIVPDPSVLTFRQSSTAQPSYTHPQRPMSGEVTPQASFQTLSTQPSLSQFPMPVPLHHHLPRFHESSLKEDV